MVILDGLDLAASFERVGPLDLPVATGVDQRDVATHSPSSSRRLVHRDINGSNIILTPER